jgi:hypothetical protein
MRIKPCLHLRTWFAPFVKGALLALLLFAVPTLSTLAKDSWYLPQSNPGHYLNIASKMQVPHCPIVFEKAPLEVIAKLERPQPLVQRVPEANPELPKPCISVTVSVQHRSPPLLSL